MPGIEVQYPTLFVTRNILLNLVIAEHKLYLKTLENVPKNEQRRKGVATDLKVIRYLV